MAFAHRDNGTLRWELGGEADPLGDLIIEDGEDLSNHAEPVLLGLAVVSALEHGIGQASVSLLPRLLGDEQESEGDEG